MHFVILSGLLQKVQSCRKTQMLKNNKCPVGKKKKAHVWVRIKKCFFYCFHSFTHVIQIKMFGPGYEAYSPHCSGSLIVCWKSRKLKCEEEIINNNNKNWICCINSDVQILNCMSRCEHMCAGWTLTDRFVP